MDQPSTSALHETRAPDTCVGCSQVDLSGLSSLTDDEDELRDGLLDACLSRSLIKPKEITNRPCFHGIVPNTPAGKINLACLQLSYDFIENIAHIPTIIDPIAFCDPENFYETTGVKKDTDTKYHDLIVGKFIPEDIEDEVNYELLYQHMVKEKKFTYINLPCKIFKKLYILPLPKENEPPFFLPIVESRINLEIAPREDNLLLGILARRPPREEGEISDKEGSTNEVEPQQPSTPAIFSPVSTDSDPFSDSEMSLGKSNKSNRYKSQQLDTTNSLNQYQSFINRPADEIPFLTDSVRAKVGSSKQIFSTSLTQQLEEISESEEELINTSVERNRKRSLSSTTPSRKEKLKQNRPRGGSSSSILDQSKSSMTAAKKPKSTSKPTVKTYETKKKSNVIDVIDINDSSNSDPDSDFFPRKLNKKLTGQFFIPGDEFSFKYRIVSSNRKNTLQYLPNSLSQKGRANIAETENFLSLEMRKVNKKVITFQLTPSDDAENLRKFNNYVTSLYARTRYGLLETELNSYRGYVFPCVKDAKLFGAFKICDLQPLNINSHELYGIIIKKLDMAKVIPPKPTIQPQGALPTVSRPRESSESSPQSSASSVQVRSASSSIREGFRELPEIVLPEPIDETNYPGLESDKILEVVNGSTKDLTKLSAKLTELIHRATEGKPLLTKLEATQEVIKRLDAIEKVDVQQYAARLQAYKTAKGILNVMHTSLSDVK